MTIVDVEQADENLSRLVDRAMSGDEVLISRGDEPLPRRRLGMLEGQITTTPDFDDPLPDDILATFEDR